LLLTEMNDIPPKSISHS